MTLSRAPTCIQISLIGMCIKTAGSIISAMAVFAAQVDDDDDDDAPAANHLNRSIYKRSLDIKQECRPAAAESSEDGGDAAALRSKNSLLAPET